MSKITPEKRIAKLEKEQKRKQYRLVMEEKMFRDVLAYRKIEGLPADQEIYLRKQIRKDMFDIMKLEKQTIVPKDSEEDTSSNSEEEGNWDKKIENKVMFGSESDRDIDEYVLTKEQYFGDDYGSEYTEGEDDGYDSESESDISDEDESAEMAFDNQSAEGSRKIVHEEDGTTLSTPRDSDDQDEINSSAEQMQINDSSSQNSENNTSGTIEMVDLRKEKKKEFVMKEFKPASKVNQSSKKRDKRKIKKQQEIELQATLEAQKLAKQNEAIIRQARAKGVYVPEPKALLKKVVAPKKVVTDEQGKTWEVVDQKKTTYVEKDSDDEDKSLSD